MEYRRRIMGGRAPKAPGFCRVKFIKRLVRWPVSRVLYSFAQAQKAIAIHLGVLLPERSCNRPGRHVEDATRVTPIWSCSRWGLPCHPCCQGRGALLPHPFTLTLIPKHKEVCFLWHFPWGRPRRALPGTVSSWSPDFPLPACAGSDYPAI